MSEKHKEKSAEPGVVRKTILSADDPEEKGCDGPTRTGSGSAAEHQHDEEEDQDRTRKTKP